MRYIFDTEHQYNISLIISLYHFAILMIFPFREFFHEDSLTAKSLSHTLTAAPGLHFLEHCILLTVLLDDARDRTGSGDSQVGQAEGLCCQAVEKQMKMDDRDRKDDHGSQSDRDQAEIV